MGGFVECQKYNISYDTMTGALPDVYILALGHHVYISGKALVPVLLKYLNYYQELILYGSKYKNFIKRSGFQ